MVELHATILEFHCSNDFGGLFSREITLAERKTISIYHQPKRILENMLFCIDANLLYVSNQTHLTGQGDCYDLSNFLPHIQVYKLL